jgi:hypothetical protein
MSIAVSNLAASAAASVAPAAAAPEGAAGFKAADLDQLRSLLRDTAIQTLPPGATLPVPENVAPVQRTFGDSILDGMLSFRNGYQSSMEAINTRVHQGNPGAQRFFRDDEPADRRVEVDDVRDGRG